MLVEIKAEEAGEQLTGGSPPDEEGQDTTQEEGSKQAAQGPSDPGCCLLGLVLLGAHWAIVGCCQHRGQ